MNNTTKQTLMLTISAAAGGAVVLGVLMLLGIFPPLGTSKTPNTGEPQAKAKDRPDVAPPRKPDSYDERMARFKDAIEKGQISAVGAMLKEGANVNDRYENAETPLMFAAAAGHHSLVVFLMSHGANVNDRDKSGRTALMRAAENGHESCVRVLTVKTISYSEAGGGASVDLQDERGETALMKAAARGKLEVVSTLWRFMDRKRCAVQDLQGRQVLGHAVLSGNADVVEFLLTWLRHNEGQNDRYLILLHEDKKGQTPVDLAEASGHKLITKTLKDELNMENPSYNTYSGKAGGFVCGNALTVAAAKGELRHVEIMLRLGINRECASSS